MNNIIILCLPLITLISISILSFAQCDNDTTNPWYVGLVPEVTIECDDDINSVFPLAYDDCDTLVDIAWYDEVTLGLCPNTRTIFRVYRAYDEFGNSAIETQMIYVVDETAPQFFEVPPSFTMSCSNNINDIYLEPFVTDNCGGTTMNSYQFVDSTNAPCEIVVTKMWTAMDDCGNTSSASQVVTIVDDIPPTITGIIDLDLPQDSLINSYATATDNCSAVTMTYTDTQVSGNYIIRDYTATDVCGNSSTFEQLIHVNNTNNLVALCHQLGNGNWITIHVAQPAVAAHLAHGDYLGPCTPGTNQWLPLYNLEKLPDGTIRKIARMQK